MELSFYLRHPFLDEFHLTEAKINAQPIVGLIVGNMRKHIFQALDVPFDLSELGRIDLRGILGPIQVGEVQPGKIFQANGASVARGALFKPFRKAPPSLCGDSQPLTVG